MEELNYKLENLNFDGPLALLLHLIERDKIDIYDIPIVEITRQYMDYVKTMQEKDLNIVSDFLVMAATLLEIKAKMLLPREVDEAGEEIDPRAELVERLLEYKRFKYMARELEKFEDDAERFFYKEGGLPEAVRSYVPPVDLDALLEGVSMEALERIFRDVMRRKEYKTDAVRAEFGTIKRERVSVGSRIGSLIRYARKHRQFSFRKMLEEGTDRTEVVVTFLAVLELMKMGKLKVTQDEAFAEIRVEATETTDLEDDMDLSSLEDL